MLKQISHTGGVTDVDEVLFSTPFGYLFPELAESEACRLAAGQDTTRALLELGDAMATDELGSGSDPHDSPTSSIFTYLGQFIDHDLTARTDRETPASEVFAPDGGALPIVPRPAAEIVRTLKNGRRPQFDLDSVYGDGPGLLYASPGVPRPGTATSAQELYDSELKFRLQHVGPTVDLPRPTSTPGSERPNERAALIADMRNDENINISQLHAAVLAFHNVVMDGLKHEGVTGAAAFVRARQYVRWTYQYIVVEEYLKTVCIADVVSDVLRNGPFFYGAVSGGLPLFMPLEFSVAAFRFGHSMIRPSYTLRSGEQLTIEQIMGVNVAMRPNNKQILEPSSGGHAFRLMQAFTVDWDQFLGATAPNKARRIDTLIAHGLGTLTFVGGMSVMAHLAKRNLIRSFSLSIPTGQAVAAACGIQPLTPKEIRDGENPEILDVLNKTTFASRSPLWYYILREGAVQTDGRSLGAVGSRIVAECLVGLLKKDPNSYINQYGIARSITKEGIEVPTKHGRKRVGCLAALLNVAGVYPQGASKVHAAEGRGRFG